MLPTLSVPSKKSTPEQQMAMMRTYLNQLKDDTEGELYNIRWDNLSKPLRDKIDSLDRDVVALQDNVVTAEWVNANTITANSLDSYLVNSVYLNSEYVYTGNLVASQITSGTIDTARLNVGAITAGLVVADDLYTWNGSAYQFKTNYLYAGALNASQITAGTIAAARLDADIIAGRFVSGNSSVFNTMNVGTIPKTNSTSGLRSYAGGGTFANIYRMSTGTPNQYYLVVNYPD